jgi:hypothetical protein
MTAHWHLEIALRGIVTSHSQHFAVVCRHLSSHRRPYEGEHMSRDSFVDPHSLLALVCQNKPLITTTSNELLRYIPFQRWDGSAGKKVPTTALLAAVDNGNDAFKGAMPDARTPFLRTRRIVTAYAPAKTVRGGDGITTWQVNGSEPFWIGNDALQKSKAESLPIGMTEDRLPDERFRHYLFACLVEVLLEAGYGPSSGEIPVEYDLYISFGIPNEEMTRKGVKESVGRTLEPIFNTPFTISRIDEQEEKTTWQLRLVEINPYPQSFASFMAWYYTLDGVPIETDIIKHVTLDIGGGQLHSCDVTLQYQPEGRPRLSMSATQLDEGTITIARAVSEQLRTHYPGVRLSDAEAQQALVSGYAQIGGRHTPIGNLVSQVIAARSARLLTTMHHVLQDEQSFLMFTGGGSILLAQSLQEMVHTKRQGQHVLFVPKDVAPVLNAIGGYMLAQTTAQKAMERLQHSLTEQR